MAGGAAVRCARTVKTASPRETSEPRTLQWLPTKDNEGARVCSRPWPNSELTLSKVGEERRGEEIQIASTRIIREDIKIHNG